eukprot:PhF_6_TR43081/c0_g1_i1/m.65778
MKRRFFDAVYVINLTHRKDRWDHITKLMGQIGFGDTEPYRRYPAIYGRNVNPQTLVKRGLLSPFGLTRLTLPDNEKIWGMDLTQGGIGCALSHIHLWSRISALNLQSVLIVEDDTEFAPNFFERLEVVWPQIPTDWEVLYLSGLDTTNECGKLMVSTNISRVPQLYRTTNLYMVNAKGSRSLLKRCVPLTFQLDTQMTMVVRDSPNVGTPSYVADPVMYACV